MQAAVNRLPNRKTGRQGENHHAKPHLAMGDDAALLGALPIAAAVIGCPVPPDRKILIAEHIHHAGVLMDGTEQIGPLVCNGTDEQSAV